MENAGTGRMRVQVVRHRLNGGPTRMTMEAGRGGRNYPPRAEVGGRAAG